MPPSLGTKKAPGDHGTEQTVDGKLRERVKGAQDYMECDPAERKPARPVVAAEQFFGLFFEIFQIRFWG